MPNLNQVSYVNQHQIRGPNDGVYLSEGLDGAG